MPQRATAEIERHGTDLPSTRPVVWNRTGTWARPNGSMATELDFGSAVTPPGVSSWMRQVVAEERVLVRCSTSDVLVPGMS